MDTDQYRIIEFDSNALDWRPVFTPRQLRAIWRQRHREWWARRERLSDHLMRMRILRQRKERRRGGNRMARLLARAYIWFLKT